MTSHVRGHWSEFGAWKFHASQIYVVVGLARAPMIVAALAQSVGRPPRVALYASVGEELIAFNVDVDRAVLTRQSSVMLPGFVQEAWASPSAPFLYIAWSNGGASYNGSGVAAISDKHGVTAFRIDANAALHAKLACTKIVVKTHLGGDQDKRT